MPTTLKQDAPKAPTVHLTTYLATLIPCIIAILFLGTLLTVSIIGDFSKDKANTSSNGSNDASNGSDTTASSDSDYAALFDAFRKLSSQDVLDLLASGGTGFVYIGRPTCPHCRAFSPLLTTASAEVGIDILYYDTDTATADGELRSQVLEAFDVTGVPAFFFVKGGTIVEKLSSTTDEPTIKNFLTKYRS